MKYERYWKKGLIDICYVYFLKYILFKVILVQAVVVIKVTCVQE
jgi:hypothetical protein